MMNWDAQAGPTGVGISYIGVTESVEAWANGAENHGWLVRAPFSTSENEPLFAGQGLPGFGMEFTTQPWAFASDDAASQPRPMIMYGMVPEPGTRALVPLGLVAIAGRRLTRRRATAETQWSVPGGDRGPTSLAFRIGERAGRDHMTLWVMVSKS